MRKKISIIAAIVLVCATGILTSCGNTTTTDSDNADSGESRLQYTDDGRAIFDGKVYSKVTEIK